MIFKHYRKSQNICKKCEHNLSKYGKPSACECCKIVAAFGGSKCMRYDINWFLISKNVVGYVCGINFCLLSTQERLIVVVKSSMGLSQPL